MKKLYTVLFSLLLTGRAFAEEIIGGADAPTEMVVQNVSISDLLGKGLIVTVGGLGGVFLVLILFYITIKLMQKIGK